MPMNQQNSGWTNNRQVLLFYLVWMITKYQWTNKTQSVQVVQRDVVYQYKAGIFRGSQNGYQMPTYKILTEKLFNYFHISIM